MTELKTQLESLEKLLVKTEQEVAEKTASSNHSRRELSTQIEMLQKELSSVKHLKEKDKEESSEHLKKVSFSTVQYQQDLQAKEQVYIISLCNFLN